MFDDIDFDNIEETEVDLNNSELENSTIGFSYQANMVESLDTSSSSHEVESDFDSASINSSYQADSFSIVDSSLNQGIDFNGIDSAECFLNHYGGSLSFEDVKESIQSASDFFNMDAPVIVSKSWTTGVFNRDLTTVADDVLIFNPDQLENMGITEKEGLDLVMTHENTHRALQGLEMGFSEHQEELCCDYMAGVRAGLNNIDTSQIINSLKETTETLSHPSGKLRVDAIKEGVDFAANYFEETGHAPTFEDCLEHFNSSNVYAQTPDPLVLVPNMNSGEREFHGYTQADVDWLEKQARTSSGSEQAHWLKEAQWARDHIHSFVDDNESLGEIHQFHGGEYGNATGDYIDDSHPYNDLGEMHGFVDDKAWNEKQAGDNLEWANWHRKEAEKAADRGDHSSARDHISKANSYDSKAKDYLDSAKKSTK